MASVLAMLWHHTDLMNGGSASPSTAIVSSQASAAGKGATPVLTVGQNALTVTEGGSITLPISVASAHGHQASSVTISGLTNYESVTDNLDHQVFSGNSITLSAAEVSSGLTLHSAYAGAGHPVNTLAVTASTTVDGHVLTSASQSIVVTDPAPSTPTASSSNTLTLQVSGDQYNGDPQIQVFVDGTQVGGTYDVTADHSAGQTQTITISGNFDPTAAHQVQVKFINDAWDGTSWWSNGTSPEGHDRNVYVESISLNGETLNGIQGTDAATNGVVHDPNPNEGAMYTDGTLTFHVAADPPATTGTGTTGTGTTGTGTGTTGTGTSGSETLTLQVSGDQYNGDPQIQVFVDGQQVGGTYTVTADHSAGQTQTITISGNFPPTAAHQVQVKFINDAWDGTTWWSNGTSPDGHDRNVYVESISLNGETLNGSQGTDAATNGVVHDPNPNEGAMYSDGTLTFNVPDPPATTGSGSTTGSSTGTGATGTGTTGTGTTGTGTTATGTGTTTVGTGAPDPAQTTQAFYVSPTGSDSNPGTLAAPFATLAHAQQAMEHGSIKTTYVEGGTYNMSSTLSLTSADNGETWQYYAASGVDTAVLNGGGSLDTVISIAPGSSHITIDGLTIENFGTAGIHVQPGGATSNAITIENNNVGHGGNPSHTSAGIIVENTTNAVVANNYVHDMLTGGIEMYAFNAGETLSGSVVKNNVVLNTVTDVSDLGAIYTEMLSTAASSLTIENNFVSGYGHAGGYGQTGIYLDEGANHVTVSGNVIGPPNPGSLPAVGTNDTAQAITVSGPHDTITGNIIDLGNSSQSFAVKWYGYSGYGLAGSTAEDNVVIMNFTGSPKAYMNGASGIAYFQYDPGGSASDFTIANNAYYNYASGGTAWSNGNMVSDSHPTTENPDLSGWTYSLASGSPVFNSPVSFTPIVGGWGPQGFTIPESTNHSNS